MKRSLKFAAFSLCAMGLGACAGGQQHAAYVAPQRVGPPQPIVTDEAYVAAVERVARRRGIYVQWVNLPSKRVTQ